MRELQGRKVGVWRARHEAIGRVPRCPLAAWARLLRGRGAAFVAVSQRPLDWAPARPSEGPWSAAGSSGVILAMFGLAGGSATQGDASSRKIGRWVVDHDCFARERMRLMRLSSDVAWAGEEQQNTNEPKGDRGAPSCSATKRAFPDGCKLTNRSGPLFLIDDDATYIQSAVLPLPRSTRATWGERETATCAASSLYPTYRIYSLHLLYNRTPLVVVARPQSIPGPSPVTCIQLSPRPPRNLQRLSSLSTMQPAAHERMSSANVSQPQCPTLPAHAPSPV